jgi:hypothetical protein
MTADTSIVRTSFDIVTRTGQSPVEEGRPSRFTTTDTRLVVLL